ncbi:MAG: transposase family protein, partial [Okeania sp. SIO1H6]|nr:transposase family protein [Okeania sp. SIO1H6]
MNAQVQQKFPQEQKFSGDKAYVGEPGIKTPKKKPKNRDLTESEKLKNKEISSKIIFVEHIIRLIKIFRVVQERFRLK